jgi:ubiquinone/menaquinone biosynthesis C-methylase UbiE
MYDEATVARYIHGQFREQAQDYARKYTAVEYFHSLLSDAFTKIGWEIPYRSRLAILDLGSGAGNSIFPLLQLCPASFVLASDLSVDLLRLLKSALMEQGLDHRVALLQLNAEELDFAADSFDVVVGAAILHHLLSPDKTLAGCARILKSGGRAIFFEPFENGNAILGLIYNAILQHALAQTLAPDVRGLLQSLAIDTARRKGRDKSSPIFQHCEDKWLFTRSYVEEAAHRAGFSNCMIYPLHSTERQFEKQTEVNLRLGVGKTREALPQWAWEIVAYYDNFFSADLKNDLLVEGGIILQK